MPRRLDRFQDSFRVVEYFVEPVDLPSLLESKRDDIAVVAIDIPIGLFDGPRACDSEARKLLGQPRGSSVFSAPCRASLSAENHRAANAANVRVTGKGLTCQAWGIAPKIKQVDDTIRPARTGYSRFTPRCASGLWLANGQCRTGKRRPLEARNG